MQTNRSTFGILFYINTSKTKKSGKCPILGRISIDGENTAFSTGLEILPDDWNAGSGKATGNSKEIIEINRQIENYKTEVGNHYRNMLENKGYLTAGMLKNALRGIGTHQNAVMQEFSNFLEEKKKGIGIKNSENTYIQYCKGYRHLKNFLKEKLSVDDIPFGKVNIALIEDFAYYLKVDLHLSAWSVHSFIAPLRTTVKRGFNRGLLRQDPFFDYTQEKIIEHRRYLSGEELERLMKTNFRRASTSFIRDMFLFSCFTGLSYSDLKDLNHSHIQINNDDNQWIVLNRKKTGTASHIPLLDIPLQILNKYKNTKFAGTEGNIFKVRTLVDFDLQLKKIAQAAGIDKRLNFHMSRHSFGTTVCLTNGIPIETLSQMMGHKSVKTTRIYAKVTRTKLNEDMTKLEKRIAGKYELPDNQQTIKNI
ncbi:MAG: site-specific integrase [Dysgonamonadaceae bacterium]|jgi:site-specific recombinase XerD|nr:site-specific integrase [Dysgonamonadaceae bacterium]